MDLHCHTSASFDCLSSPASVVRAAASRGLTHLAITDHETVAGALEARDLAREQTPALTVLVGEEVRTREGDLIAMFIERAVPRGMSAMETIAAIREQGGLVGVPHPFDRYRGSLLRALEGSPLETPVDWIEIPLQQLVAAVRSVLEQTPPELSSDIIDKGMVMSGGGSLLRNIDKLLTQVTGVPCHVAENSLNCVALGTGLALEHFDFFKKSLVQQI